MSFEYNYELSISIKSVHENAILTNLTFLIILQGLLVLSYGLIQIPSVEISVS